MSAKSTNLDYVDSIEPQDGIGKSYEALQAMATKSYWVTPINAERSTIPRDRI